MRLRSARSDAGNVGNSVVHRDDPVRDSAMLASIASWRSNSDTVMIRLASGPARRSICRYAAAGRAEIPGVKLHPCAVSTVGMSSRRAAIRPRIPAFEECTVTMSGRTSTRAARISPERPEVAERTDRDGEMPEHHDRDAGLAQDVDQRSASAE